MTSYIHLPKQQITAMTSFVRQFDFHDIIYHIQHCNFDNRRQNVLQLMDVQNERKNVRCSPNKSYENV